MKKFVTLIKQIHEEHYSKVLERIMGQKIPVVFTALTPLADAIETANDFCK